MVIYFTGYVHKISIKMFSPHCNELMGNVEEHEGKTIWRLMIVLRKIREIIGIDKFNDTKILMDTDHKLPDDFTLKNALILTKCVIKDDYQKLLLKILFTNIFGRSIVF